MNFGPQYTRWRIFHIPQRFHVRIPSGPGILGIPKKKIIGLKPKRVIREIRRPKRIRRKIDYFLNPPIGTFVITVGNPTGVPVTMPGTNTYSVNSGYLPPGMTLNPTTGVITGTPTVTGTYAFTILSVGTTTGVAPYTIIVQPAVPAILQPKPCS